MTWKLIFEGINKDAPPFPFEAKNFRGAVHEITGGQPPHKPSSAGFVHIEGRELYPSVYGLKWVKESDNG